MRTQNHSLTARETEVLGRVSEGLCNKAIARELGISDRTVKAHLGEIFGKLGVQNRTQAAAFSKDERARSYGLRCRRSQAVVVYLKG